MASLRAWVLTALISMMLLIVFSMMWEESTVEDLIEPRKDAWAALPLRLSPAFTRGLAFECCGWMSKLHGFVEPRRATR